MGQQWPATCYPHSRLSRERDQSIPLGEKVYMEQQRVSGYLLSAVIVHVKYPRVAGASMQSPVPAIRRLSVTSSSYSSQ